MRRRLTALLVATMLPLLACTEEMRAIDEEQQEHDCVIACPTYVDWAESGSELTYWEWRAQE